MQSAEEKRDNSRTPPNTLVQYIHTYSGINKKKGNGIELQV